MLKRKNILLIFLENEKKIEKLYNLYALKFPNCKKLWLDLAREEKFHVEILLVLTDKFDSPNQFFKPDQYLINILIYANNFINKQLKKSSLDKISLEEALAVALRIEQSILENKCFEIFEPMLDEIKLSFARLNYETARHVKKLRSFLKS